MKKNSKFYVNKKSIIAITVSLTSWIMLSSYTQTLCWVRSLLGFPCPGCGSTRAAVALLRGNIAEALHYHPLIILSLIILIYLTLKKLRLFRFAQMKKYEKYISLIIIILYIAVYIVRMVQYFPNIEPMTISETALWQGIYGFFT